MKKGNRYLVCNIVLIIYINKNDNSSRHTVVVIAVAAKGLIFHYKNIDLVCCLDELVNKCNLPCKEIQSENRKCHLQ